MEDERVTLRINNQNDLGIARPGSQSLFERLLERVRRGETVTISLSKADWKRRQIANQAQVNRDDSDAGATADL